MTNHSTTLRFWLDRHNTGDATATTELIRFSEDRFRRLVRSRLRQFDRLRRFEDTDDVLVGVQTRFATALRDRRFDTLVDFLRFGATLIGHQLIDFSRHYFGPLGQGRREVAIGGNELGGPGRVEPQDPAAGPADLARVGDIDGVIDRLPAEHREVFHALYYLGLTQADAADVLDVSLSTLKRRWVEAREMFLQQYEGDLS